MEDKKFIPVTKLSVLEKIVDQILSKGLDFATDVETTGLSPRKDKVVGVGICFHEDYSFYVPVNHAFGQAFKAEDVEPILRRLFSETRRTILAFNALFDIGFLRHSTKCSIDLNKVKDVLFMAAVLGRYKHLKLSYVCKQELGFEVWDYPYFMTSVGLRKNGSIADAKISEVSEYCGRDVLGTFMLYNKIWPLLRVNKIYQLEEKLFPVTSWMKDCGIKLDVDYIIKEKDRTDQCMKRLENEIFKTIGHEFNLASTKQLGEVFTDLGLKLNMTEKGNISTDEKCLLGIQTEHKAVPLVMKHKKLAKLNAMAWEKLPKHRDIDGRIHANFNQTGAITGRYSSSDPNLQQIAANQKIKVVDKEEMFSVRKSFVAEPGWWIFEADYSQIEARLAAGITREPILLNAFARGIDFHVMTASLIFNVPVNKVTKEQRRIAKTINFALIYGGSYKVLLEAFLKQEEPKSIQECRKLRDKYIGSYPIMFGCADRIRDKSEIDKCVYTIFGRKIPIFEYEIKEEKFRHAGRRLAYNGVIQGSAADIMKRTLIQAKNYIFDKNLQSLIELWATIHDAGNFHLREDQLIDFIPAYKALSLFTKEEFPQIYVECKLGKNWGEMIEQEKDESDEDFIFRVTGNKYASKSKVNIKTYVLAFPSEETTEGVLTQLKEELVKHQGFNRIKIKMGDKIRSWDFYVSDLSNYILKLESIFGGKIYEE